MRTAEQIIDMMKHAIGGTPDSRHDLWATLNEAGRALTNWSRWSWRFAGPTTLIFETENEKFALPEDFGEIDACAATTPTVVIRIVSSSEIMWMRSRNIRSGYVYYIHFPEWTAPSDSGDSQRPQGMIWPLNTIENTPIQITYWRRWVELKSTDPSAYPAIPAEYERALVLLARDFALCYQTDQPSIESDAAVKEITRLIEADARRQPFEGQITGGASRFVGRRDGTVYLRDIGVTPASS